MRDHLFKLKMVKALGLLCIILVSNIISPAKELPKYVVSNIPEEFRKNANAVYWEDRMVFQIHAQNKATFKVFQAVTILNANAKRHTSVVVGYDKLSKVLIIKGTIYDADGFVLKRIKPSEIYDQSAFDGSLFSDNRLKSMDLSSGNYPYTIEYEYELEYKYLFDIPDFSLLGDEQVSSLSAEYTLIYPKDLKPRFSTHNIDVAPQVNQIGSNIESTSWKFKNTLPIVFEPFSPHPTEIIPGISAAPSVFDFDGYKGSMDSWENFGLWIGTLNKGRNILPPATVEKIRSIASEFPKPEEKIMAVYEYLQSKTRYVSIQLGIGGFQPFEASVVDQVGYGDCKALSNYMVSLLSAINIKAHYVLVKAGGSAPKLNVNFPSSQFNHAIVCVPLEKDTIWLECTSQTNPFGYMGTFTGNRKALAITEKGARPVNTPIYTEKENRQSRTADVFVDIAGNAKAKIVTTYAGTQYEIDGAREVLGANHDEQKKWVQENTNIPAFDVNSFSFKNIKTRIPSAIVRLDLTLNRFATVSGKRLFLTPNLMNKSTYIPTKTDSRKNKVVLINAYTHLDTINYFISDKIYPENLPEPVKIQSRFGEYECSFKLEQGRVVYIRKFVRKNGEFPAEAYSELVDFYKAINKADNTKMVFLTKT
jgi:hypothetical protein